MTNCIGDSDGDSSGGINTQQRIVSLEGDRNEILAFVEGLFRQYEEQVRQALDNRELVEKLTASIELGKMESAELTRKLTISEDRIDCLETCMEKCRAHLKNNI